MDYSIEGDKKLESASRHTLIHSQAFDETLNYRKHRKNQAKQV